MLGLVFQHITHWANEVDEKQYTKPLNAAVALHDFLSAASIADDKTIAA